VFGLAALAAGAPHATTDSSGSGSCCAAAVIQASF
jgi:hypothetical protein